MAAGFALVWSGIAAAACDPAILNVADGPVPYASRAGGRYCEGSYARPVGAAFEILSVTAGPIAFGQDDTQIILSAPLSPPSSTVNIRARGRAINYGYQMDATLASPSTFAWPTTALKALKLGRTDIGVFGFRTNGTGITYVPIAARRTASASNSDPILVQIIAPEHINGPIEYRVTPENATVPEAWQTASETGLNKGEVLTVRLAANTLATAVTMSVRARARTDLARWVRLSMAMAR